MARKLEVETSLKDQQRRRARENDGLKENRGSGDSFVGEDPQFIGFLLRESVVVSIHTIAFISIRALLLHLDTWDDNWFGSIFTIPLRWPLRFLLGDIKSFRHPALFLSPPWMLLFIQSKTNIMPNLAYRICQQQMGLSTLKELFSAAATHLITATLIVSWIRRFLSSETYSHIVPVIEYENDSLRIVQVANEAILTLLFVVGMQVIPVLLTINRISVYWTTVFMYPLYCVSVDSLGVTSALNPLYLWSQAFRGENIESCHLAGQITGAIVAGHVMNRYFPEEKTRQNANSKCFV